MEGDLLPDKGKVLPPPILCRPKDIPGDPTFCLDEVDLLTDCLLLVGEPIYMVFMMSLIVAYLNHQIIILFFFGNLGT
jgi:hypothetical protein